MLGRIAFGKRITPHALDRRQRIILATANGKPGIDHRQREQKLVFLREPVADLDRPVPLFVLDRLRQQHEPGVEAGLTCLFKRPGQFKAELFIARKQRQPEGALPQYPIVLAGLERGLELRSEEHTSELQSLMRISYAVFCLKKKQ